MSTEFGGGLGRFASNSQKSIYTCREIVEIPGGAEWKIRKLQWEFEHFCWKYPGNSVIVNYHFNRLQNCEDPLDENQKMFYGKVSHFMSPVEISIQPKYLSSVRKSITEQLNTTYQFKSTCPAPFSNDQIFAPVACAVNELGIWYRGRIRQISGEEHVVVELVDFGTEILAPRSKILPLHRRFGKAPPLCLKCRVDGLSINDLEITDLHQFKDVISECNALFRVEIKSLEEPYVIDLYHPTISGKNVCEKFKPPPDDVGKMDRYERSWQAHCKKINEHFDDDEDVDSEEELGSGDFMAPITFIKRLPKCERAPRFEKDLLSVAHIENSQLVYLRYPWQAEKLVELDTLLVSTWKSLPRLPKHLRIADQICAIRNARKGGIVRRAVIIDEVTVLLVDYGLYVKCPSSADLRLIPAQGILTEAPMVTVVSMTRGANMLTPHHSETQFLRKKLENKSLVQFKWDKKSKTTPLRGRLTLNGQKQSINEQMVAHLNTRRIDGRCRQLDIYRPRATHVLQCGNHVYRSMCHHHYSKGNEEFVKI